MKSINFGKATVSEIWDVYKKYKNPKLRESSIETRDYIFTKHILPYFGNVKYKNITGADIDEWHGIILKKNLSGLRTRAIHMAFSALFNFVETRYEVLGNPCRVAGTIGSKKRTKKLNTWDLAEFQKVVNNITNYTYKTAVSLLFWTGLRKNEMYGLTWADFDTYGGLLDINKAYVKEKGSWSFTSLKSDSSYRMIALPKFLVEELITYKAWREKNEGKLKQTDFIIPWSKRKLEDAMREGEQKGGVKRIRVHDLRHSHATLCLNSGINIVAVSQRLGHEKVSTTVNIYNHTQKKHEAELITWLESQNNLI